jgi:mono/diheme cytochrome c family protein
VLVYFGFVYLDQYAGGFNSLVYEPFDSFAAVKKSQPASGSPLIAQGREVYGRTCTACHQPGGLGTAGQFPPLAGSDWVNAAGPDRIIRIVLNGLQGPVKVNGTDFNNAMVPWKDTLKDDEIAAVITFIRQEWGNKAPAVTPAQISAVRDATKDRNDPWTADELLKVPEGGEAK